MVSVLTTLSVWERPRDESRAFIHSFFHSFNKHLLSAYYVPGTVQGAKGTMENEVPALVEFTF